MPNVPALDGLRGLAILLVLWAHFGPNVLPDARGGLPLALHNLLGAGWAGVDLFFVLSGFLITGILLDAKTLPVPAHLFPPGSLTPGRSDADSHDSGHSGSASRATRYFGRFYARRALRIFPLYYLVLTGITIFTTCVGRPPDVRAWREWAPWLWFYGGNLFNARHGWRAGPHGLLLNHFWTLAVEEQFYLIWPVIVYACGRKTLRGGCFGAIAFAVALRFHCSVVDGNGYAATLLMPCRIDAFAVGGLVALAVRGSLPRERLSRIGATMAASASSLLLPTFYNFQWMDVVGRTLLAILFGGSILLALFTSLRRPLEARV